ncbi:MAG: amidohydrolase family protein [bacterium]|nr:amidohydrolase family protein [bacterium]
MGSNPLPYRRFDAHAHVAGRKTAYAGLMDALNIRAVLNIAWSDFREPEAVAAYEAALREDVERHPSRFLFCPTFSLTGFWNSGYADQIIAKLDRDLTVHKAVAVKIWKDLGMMLRNDSGEYTFCDDPVLEPVFSFLEERRVPVWMHIGDPIQAWRPLDPSAHHYGYYANHPEFHWHGRSDRPSHEEIMDHRDRLVARHPGITFVGAHLASLSHDVEQVGAFLDAHPNALVDASARWRDLSTQPQEAVRAFFVQYQDRVLWGNDWTVDESTFSENPEERATQTSDYIEGFTRQFDYYERQLALPPEILRKFYWENAARLFNLPLS